jgi:hypothetical protein
VISGELLKRAAVPDRPPEMPLSGVTCAPVQRPHCRGLLKQALSRVVWFWFCSRMLRICSQLCSRNDSLVQSTKCL